MIRATLYLSLCGLASLSATALASVDTVIPEVSLTAQTEVSAETVTGQMTTISHKKIAHSADTSLSDLLRDESAVRVTNNSGNTSQPIISIRGFGDNAVANSLILVDGFPLMNASLLAPNFNALILSDVQKINLFQGSQGSLWGDQAVGGVMDIETLHPEKKVANVDLAYGSYDKQYLSGLFADHLSNGVFYKLSGFTNHTDNYRQHDQQGNSGLAAEEGYDYATGSISLKQNITEDSFQYPGSLSLQQYETDPQQATDNQDHTSIKTQIYQLLSKQSLNDDWLLETRLSSTNIQSYGWFYSPFNNNESLYWFNPKLVGQWRQNQITVGYVGSTSYYSSYNSSVASKAYALENDLYGQTIIPLTKKWDLTLGARSAWQSNDPEIVIGEPVHYLNRVFVTEQGLAFHVNSDWTWFLRRDGNFRFPKANEEVWLASDQTELKPQTGVSYETGLQWHTARQKSQLSIYELWLHNEIAYDPTQTPTQPFGATSNFDTTLRKGISLSDEVTLTEKIAVNGQLNYVDARFVAGSYAGNLIPAVPAWNGTAGAEYQFDPHWQTRVNELYNGSSYASDDVANTGSKADLSWLTQWSLQYLCKDYSIDFQVNNVFNQSYAVFTLYDATTQSNSYYPGSGRNFTLNLKINLV